MKQKKSFLIISAIALSFGCIGLAALTNAKDNIISYVDADKTYDIKLDNSNGFTNANYSIATQTKTYGLVTVNGFLAKAYDGGFAKLASNGAIYNYSAAEYHGRVTGINNIKVTFTGGTLKLRVSRDLSGKIFSDPVSLTSGTLVDLSSVAPNFFILEAGDSEISIEKIELNYNCSERSVLSLNQLGKTYTGEKSDIVYKAVINGSAFTIDTLNKATNDHYEGTASIEGNQVKFAVDGAGNLYFNPNEGRTKLTVDATKGIGAQFSGLAFDEVFKVDDFENMAQGSGYDDVTKSFTTMTGLRAKFLSDFNNSETTRTTSPLGWKLMGSSDYLTLASGTGHNGSNAAVFKVSNSAGLRYVTMSSLYNVPRTMGKGSTFSFWAHGPVTAQGAAASTDVKIKVRLFYVNPVTSVSDSTGDAKEITIPKGTDWTRYEIPMASNKDFYGYCIFSNSSSQYLPIDDVEIFTANPYVVSSIPVSSVSVSPTAQSVVTGQSFKLTPTVLPEDATDKSVTYSSSNSSIATVDAAGNVTGVNPGNATITVTTVDGAKTATCAVTVTVPSLTYPEGTYHATVSVASVSGEVVISFGKQSSGLVAVRVSNADMEPGAVEYNNETHAFSIPTTGTVTFKEEVEQLKDLTAGTITGTFDPTNNRLINVNCDGDLSAAVNNATLTRPSESYYEMDGSSSQMFNQFKRRYRSNGSGWQVDSGNTDRFEKNTTQYVSGTSAMNVRPFSTGDAYGFTLMNDFASARALKNIHFWVYNSGTEDVVFREWVYTTKDLGGAKEIGSLTAPHGQWTYLAMGYDYTIYNFTISVWTKDGDNNVINSSAAMGTKLTFDNLYLF